MLVITEQLKLSNLYQHQHIYTETTDEKKEVVGGGVLRIAADHVTCWKSNQSDAHLHTASGSMCVCFDIFTIPDFVCLCVHVFRGMNGFLRSGLGSE